MFMMISMRLMFMLQILAQIKALYLNGSLENFDSY